MPAPDSFLGQTVSHSAEHNDAKETAATYQAAAALREAESGNREQARAERRTGELLTLSDYFPLVPILLPTPVTKSYPVLQLKVPAVPETISRKSPVPMFE
jgi:hypothetical protein